MGINKVMYGSKTVIDLSGSTVAPDKMLEGIIGYNAAGEEVIGTHQCEKGIGNALMCGQSMTVKLVGKKPKKILVAQQNQMDLQQQNTLLAQLQMMDIIL